jgi:hypothetical protein
MGADASNSADQAGMVPLVCVPANRYPANVRQAMKIWGADNGILHRLWSRRTEPLWASVKIYLKFN